MPVVTELKAQRRKGKVNVYLDGSFSFGLDVETAVKWGLKVGKELTSVEVEKILKEGEWQVNYEKCLKFISLRPRSEKEVRDWCRRKKLGERLGEMILEKLRKQKLIDDEEFTRWWIEQRMTFIPRGRRVIEQELWRKGVERKIVDQVYQSIEKINPPSHKAMGGKGVSGFSEVELARRAGEKKMRSLGRYAIDEKREKLIGFLQRRGFNWEVVKTVVDELVGGGKISIS